MRHDDEAALDFARASKLYNEALTVPISEHVIVGAECVECSRMTALDEARINFNEARKAFLLAFPIPESAVKFASSDDNANHEARIEFLEMKVRDIAEVVSEFNTRLNNLGTVVSEFNNSLNRLSAVRSHLENVANTLRSF